MKLTRQELKILIDKYNQEGLSKKEIYNRLKHIFEMEDYIKFKEKYLK